MIRTCTKCNESKSFDFYYKSKTGRDGISAECKTCFCKRQRAFEARPDVLLLKAGKKKDKRHSDPLYNERHKQHGLRWQRENRSISKAKTARYRAAKMRAIPAWYDEEKVLTVYEKAQNFGMSVDHVVPLQSDIVCGLHVWENLQLLDQSINSSKCNRYWPDMPDSDLLTLERFVGQLSGVSGI